MVTPERFGKCRQSNVTHDGSDEVLALFPDFKSTGGQASLGAFRKWKNVLWKRNKMKEIKLVIHFLETKGSARRSFYTAKASELDRIGSKDPTVKPVSLMRWLVRLIMPPNGTVLDMFAGDRHDWSGRDALGISKSVLIEWRSRICGRYRKTNETGIREEMPLKREKN